MLSMISSGELTSVNAEDYQANPCSFYLLNLAIDVSHINYSTSEIIGGGKLLTQRMQTTLGIPVLIILLKIVTYGFSLTPLASPPESIKSGNYGRPPQTTWWLKQCFIYFIGLLGMKVCVFIIFQLCPWIIRVGDWALRWTEGNQTLQIFFVMLFFPVVMNALQYYIIDSFIKDDKPSDQHESVPSDADDDGRHDDHDEHGINSRDQEDADDDDDDAVLLHDGGGEEEAALIKKDASNDPQATSRREEKESQQEIGPDRNRKQQQQHNEYDPTTDGASSSSGGSRDDKRPRE